MKKWRLNHIAHHGFESEHLLHVPYDDDHHHHDHNKNVFRDLGDNCLFVCLFLWWIVLRTSQQKKLLKKLHSFVSSLQKPYKSSDPKKKGQEEAWRMIEEAFGGECRIRNKCLSVCQSHKQNQQWIPNMQHTYVESIHMGSESELLSCDEIVL